MTTIYLARHATPDWNRKDLTYHLPPGPPLVEQGWLESIALGEFFKQAGVRLIYTSPLERCEHTAQIAAEVVGVEPETLPGLGEWQPNENWENLGKRMQPVFERLVEEAEKEGPAAAVTHGGPIMVLLEALGMARSEIEDIRVFDHNNLVPPAGVWKIHRDKPDQAWQMVLVFQPETQADE